MDKSDLEWYIFVIFLVLFQWAIIVVTRGAGMAREAGGYAEMDGDIIGNKYEMQGMLYQWHQLHTHAFQSNEPKKKMLTRDRKEGSVKV